MLTPLNFSCSPELLVPERGKKIGLLQVAKKALLPKFTASKLDPPTLAPATPPELFTKDKALPIPASKLQDVLNIFSSEDSKTPSSTFPERVGTAHRQLLSVGSAPALRQRPTTSSGVISGTSSLSQVGNYDQLLLQP